MTLLHEIISKTKDGFSHIYGSRLSSIVLFGSHARGDEEPGSDIDLLIVLEGDVCPITEIERTGTLVASLSLHYDVVISCIFMDKDRFLHRNGPLLRNIRREGITV